MFYSPLTLVTNKNHTPQEEYIKFLEECILYGISSIQLREKQLTIKELINFGFSIKKLTEKYNIPLIINDSLEVCKILNANGLHLGQNDGDVILARRILGKNKIIGLSVENKEQALIANTLPLDYVGASAVFSSVSKTNLNNILGVNGLKEIYNVSKHSVIAIGGINLDNTKQVVPFCHGIAVINTIHTSKTLKSTIQNFLTLIKKDI